MEDCIFGLAVQLNVLTDHDRAQECCFVKVKEVHSVKLVDYFVVELVLLMNA